MLSLLFSFFGAKKAQNTKQLLAPKTARVVFINVRAQRIEQF